MFYRHRHLALLGVYVLTSLALLSWSADNVVRTLKATTAYLLSPVEDPVLGTMETWGRFGARFSRLIHADSAQRTTEWAWMKEQLENRRSETVEAENARLSALLKMPPHPKFHARAARLWSRDAADWFHSVEIRYEGEPPLLGDAVIVLQSNRPVVLGQVVEAAHGAARVLLVTDPLSAVSARVERTGEQGIVEGLGSDRLALNYLFSDSDIRTDDEVTTAGLGDLFPEGFLIGHVVDVREASRGSFKGAILRPAVRLNQLHEVLVLSRRGDGSGTVTP